jgi:hypothetical protein
MRWRKKNKRTPWSDLVSSALKMKLKPFADEKTAHLLEP